jgi:transcriptional regulator with XRE-family HTH domain
MKIKNYQWNGYGFPVIFSELPAVRLRGELVPDVDFNLLAKPLIKIICAKQPIPFSGNQVKFIRHHLGMSMREFAQFMDVTHQSVMRWEKKAKSAARIDINTEIVMRLRILKTLKSDAQSIEEVVEKVNDVEKLKPTANYVQKFKPIWVPENIIQSAV